MTLVYKPRTPFRRAAGTGGKQEHTRGARQSAGPMTYVILTCLVIFAIGPIVLFFFNALKTTDQYAANALNPPKSWQWSNFVTAWTQVNMGAGLWNSAVIVLGTVILTCIVAGCAAYALARLEIKGHAVFITYLLVASSLPTQVFLVPLFYMWTKAGLYDSRFGLILIYCGLFSPFATLRLRSLLLSIPRNSRKLPASAVPARSKCCCASSCRMRCPGC